MNGLNTTNTQYAKELAAFTERQTALWQAELKKAKKKAKTLRKKPTVEKETPKRRRTGPTNLERMRNNPHFMQKVSFEQRKALANNYMKDTPKTILSKMDETILGLGEKVILSNYAENPNALQLEYTKEGVQKGSKVVSKKREGIEKDLAELEELHKKAASARKEFVVDSKEKKEQAKEIENLIAARKEIIAVLKEYANEVVFSEEFDKEDYELHRTASKKYIAKIKAVVAQVRKEAKGLPEHSPSKNIAMNGYKKLVKVYNRLKKDIETNYLALNEKKKLYLKGFRNTAIKNICQMPGEDLGGKTLVKHIEEYRKIN